MKAGLLRASAGEMLYGERSLRRFTMTELARTRAQFSQHAHLRAYLIALSIATSARKLSWSR
jgi:hypothetical protein